VLPAPALEIMSDCAASVAIMDIALQGRVLAQPMVILFRLHRPLVRMEYRCLGRITVIWGSAALLVIMGTALQQPAQLTSELRSREGDRSEESNCCFQTPILFTTAVAQNEVVMME
jgi:hypothetical protein